MPSNHQPTLPLCPQHHREPLIPTSSLSTAPSALQFNTGALCGGLDWVSKTKHCQKRKTLDKKQMGSSAAQHQVCRKPRMPMNTQRTQSPSRGAKPETTGPGGPEEHTLPPTLKPCRGICTRGHLEPGQQRLLWLQGGPYTRPPLMLLTSSVKSNTRLSNSQGTGEAVPSMGGFGQDRKEKGKPSLTWPNSRLGLQTMPWPNTQPAGSRTQCLAPPWTALVLSDQTPVASDEPWENGEYLLSLWLGLSSGERRTLHSAGRCYSHCNFRRNLLMLHV